MEVSAGMMLLLAFALITLNVYWEYKGKREMRLYMQAKLKEELLRKQRLGVLPK